MACSAWCVELWVYWPGPFCIFDFLGIHRMYFSPWMMVNNPILTPVWSFICFWWGFVPLKWHLRADTLGFGCTDLLLFAALTSTLSMRTMPCFGLWKTTQYWLQCGHLPVLVMGLLCDMSHLKMIPILVYCHSKIVPELFQAWYTHWPW